MQDSGSYAEIIEGFLISGHSLGHYIKCTLSHIPNVWTSHIPNVWTRAGGGQTMSSLITGQKRFTAKRLQT